MREAQDHIENIEDALTIVASAVGIASKSAVLYCNLLKRFQTLWTFLHDEGEEPGNNLIERAPSLLYRVFTSFSLKQTFGSGIIFFMNWTDIEKAFSRAMILSFSKRKMFLTFPVLVLCGVMTVFCRAVAHDASDWIAMSLAFLPILLSSGVLLALGVLLVRIHIHEVKGLNLSLKRLVSGSIDLLMGTSYLSIPPILAYFFLWMGLGIFYLLGEIPGIGTFFSVVLAFGPFLLVFGALLLCFCNLTLLFFVAPIAAMQSSKRISITKRLFTFFQGQILTSFSLFLLALVPIFLVTGLLILAAFLSNTLPEKSLSVAIQWFFVMLPFVALVTPAVIFFFNFAAESYQLLHTKKA